MKTEFGRIERWFMPLSEPSANPPVVLGNGDDALGLKTSQVLVMSMDTAVAGTHFPEGAAAADVASKALRSALSDLAAMGARPWFYTLSVVIPRSFPESWWAEFSRALRQENHHWQLPCLGGDTTAGAVLVVTVQVHGLCDRPLTRAAAEVQDDIWVTGTLGSAAAGLRLVLAPSGHPEATPDQQNLVDAFYRPPLPLSLMQAVAPQVHAAIDVSDGLLADLAHVLKASQCGAHLMLEAVPLAASLVAEAGQDDALELALSGGEDYVTCFTAAPSSREFIVQSGAKFNTPVHRIGRITAEPGCLLTLGGLPHTRPFNKSNNTGYDHFD